MPVDGMYLYSCDADVCGEKECTWWRQYVRDEVPRPSPPDGWQVVNGAWYCGRHDVRVAVDEPYEPVARKLGRG